MKKKFLILLLPSLLFLAGCMTVNMKTNIEKNGACIRKIEVVTSKTIGLLPHKPFGVPKDKNWSVEEVFLNGKYHYKATGKFKSPEKINWRYSKISFSKERHLFSTIYSYKEIFNAKIKIEEIKSPPEKKYHKEIKTGKDLWKEFKRTLKETRARWQKRKKKQLGSIKITSTITMPGKIINANTTQIRGNTATWQFTMANVEKGYEISVQSKKMSATYNITLTLIILLSLSGVFWLIRKLMY